MLRGWRRSSHVDSLIPRRAPAGVYAPTVPMDGELRDFPDPFVFRSADGRWYAYATGSGFCAA